MCNRKLIVPSSFKLIVPISAKNGEQLDAFLNIMEESLPECLLLYPEDTLTESTTKFITSRDNP